MEILKFKPYLKTVIWGGDKICSYKGISRPEPHIGESWEISGVKGHESEVAEGPLRGLTIADLARRFGAAFLGTRVFERYGEDFPLLIKFIDAADNLSVQVHPDDDLAARRHNCRGKTEMWYIVQSDDDAKIYAGLNRSMTPDEYVERVAAGTFAETLAVQDSFPGDVFFLPAGRVHAIGAGNLLAEIQETSDITYRIYDYDRRDAQGNPRELHTDLAKDAIDYRLYDNYKSPRPSDKAPKATIAECRHFKVVRLVVDGSAELTADPGTFAILICISGEVKALQNGSLTGLRQGETCLIPADSDPVTLTGSATLLIATC